MEGLGKKEGGWVKSKERGEQCLTSPCGFRRGMRAFSIGSGDGV